MQGNKWVNELAKFVWSNLAATCVGVHTGVDRRWAWKAAAQVGGTYGYMCRLGPTTSNQSQAVSTSFNQSVLESSPQPPILLLLSLFCFCCWCWWCCCCCCRHSCCSCPCSCSCCYFIVLVLILELFLFFFLTVGIWRWCKIAWRHLQAVWKTRKGD